MAVFTSISKNDINDLLTHFTLGKLISFHGILSGIENTNYFLTTTYGQYVLTIFEVLKKEELPFYIELMNFLAKKDIPVPQPQTMHCGSRLAFLHGKPCIIVSRLPGRYEQKPSEAHCILAGTVLAATHLAAKNFYLYQPNLRDLLWCTETASKVMKFLNKNQVELLKTVLNEQKILEKKPILSALPMGPAHCDLFRENLLFCGTFENPKIGGIIDFYFAGFDRWLFDVAVTANDWCIKPETGELIPKLLDSFLRSYAKIRPFTYEEREVWPYILCAAALRFWLSRLYDSFLPRLAKNLKPHDPFHFEKILNVRMEKKLFSLPLLE